MKQENFGKKQENQTNGTDNQPDKRTEKGAHTKGGKIALLGSKQHIDGGQHSCGRKEKKGRNSEKAILRGIHHNPRKDTLHYAILHHGAAFATRR